MKINCLLQCDLLYAPFCHRTIVRGAQGCREEQGPKMRFPLAGSASLTPFLRCARMPPEAAYVSVRNLFEDEDYAKQFEETASRFKKGKKYDERKYYHFKLSCARKDNVDAQEAHIYAEELAAKLFPDCECVIATHTDTQTVHSHIIVNAVQPLTGKKLHITDREYTKMKDSLRCIDTRPKGTR